jgi:hypothetical protein
LNADPPISWPIDDSGEAAARQKADPATVFPVNRFGRRRGPQPESQFPRLWYADLIMEQIRVVYEEIKVLGQDLVDKVGQLIHAGNVRRIIVKDDRGNTFMEIPLTVATVGVVAVPVLAGLGALAALIANFTIGVEKIKGEADGPGPDGERPGES